MLLVVEDRVAVEKVVKIYHNPFFVDSPLRHPLWKLQALSAEGRWRPQLVLEYADMGEIMFVCDQGLAVFIYRQPVRVDELDDQPQDELVLHFPLEQIHSMLLFGLIHSRGHEYEYALMLVLFVHRVELCWVVEPPFYVHAIKQIVF